MADKKISAVSLLPEFLKTERNKKFLTSTLDQLIQKPQLERLDGYVGSTLTPTYNSTADIYISNSNPYQLSPAFIIYDNLENIKTVQGYDDLLNALKSKGANIDNLDYLFRTEAYSYTPHIDWDKLVNYQNYYWMPQGPEVLSVTTEYLDVETEIEGQVNASVEVLTTTGTSTLINLSNGMMLEFSGQEVNDTYHNRAFFVEGVGTSIKLIPLDRLLVSEKFMSSYPDGFDSYGFDTLPFDNDRELPILYAEYVTINRASTDLNPWSRYNRWVHKDVIRTSALVNGVEPDFSQNRAQRPIIEFKPNIKLFNFGTVGIDPVDLLDTSTTDPFDTIAGTTMATYVDGIELEEGHRVIFNAIDDPNVKGKIFEIHFVFIQGVRTLTLQPAYDYDPLTDATVTILLGDENNSTDWRFDGTIWVSSQQRDTLNQSPLFDLFDENGNSYSDKNYYLSNFSGNKIFSYTAGTGNDDPYLGFPIAYKNLNAIGSILFDNNLAIETIILSQIGVPSYSVNSNIGFIKVDNQLKNSWVETSEYEIPVLASTATGITSYYEEPLGLTNNPLNGIVEKFTISELTEHVLSMTNRIEGYNGNLRDREDFSNLGTKLISSSNPLSFTQMFLGVRENNLIDAIDKSAENYNNFKLAFLNKMLQVSDQLSPSAAVDQILTELNQYKSSQDPYYLTDMVGYGTPEHSKTWIVTNSNNTIYPLSTDSFDLTNLSLRAIYVYLDGEQLLHGTDYLFDSTIDSVEILVPLEVGDELVINEYKDTEGCYIPPTPTKLGLYSKFKPDIFVDDVYATPQTVIQGHDGSIIIAYEDYRDTIILELEKRIYNNIKVEYRDDILTPESIRQRPWRNMPPGYGGNYFNTITSRDFSTWTDKFGLKSIPNTTFDPDNSKTWNFYNARNETTGVSVGGSWRGVLDKLYDTERPHTCPWEMLGLTEKPNWWEDLYGPAPYTGGNLVMWDDIQNGRINGVINPLFVRSNGFNNIIPVDSSGNLLSPEDLLTGITDESKQLDWQIDERSPVKVAWHRSSYFPFTMQKAMALTKPARYAALMYDTSRIKKNSANQWIHTSNKKFPQLAEMFIHNENKTQTSGYSVFLSEIGMQEDKDYIKNLRQDLTYASYNLIYKLNGFADKDTLQIIVDAYAPTSTSPGSILPSQNYKLRLNVGNPILSVTASGMIIERTRSGYNISGYDRSGYFNIFKPIRNLGTTFITVGGETVSYVAWAPSGSGSATGLNSIDTTSASSAPVGNFYKTGQYVQYGNDFYVTKVGHRAGNVFNVEYFQKVPRLPTEGGASVQVAVAFESTVTPIDYGTTFSSIQEVYDVIIGYGRWLESRGFVFSEYNIDLDSVIDWNLSAKEFLFWSTQPWATRSIITLSPFADKVIYKSSNAVVDNLFQSYEVLRADKSVFLKTDLNISRDDGICTIATAPNSDGIYYIQLNLVQKEHVIIFDNKTIFDDVIYKLETGSRQRRIKLVGFRTANWNGDYFSPGFVYDTAEIVDWVPNTPHTAGTTVRFNGKYYSAIRNIERRSSFDFNQWALLDKKPEPALLPNFDYKISQFEDFYSLDSDNFDEGQQRLSQHLTGYTPRVYLNNIFPNTISQYKFYQGFIREKGTQNAISKLAKASSSALKGNISYNEEWAFRVGNFGSFPTYQEIETPLIEGTFLENPQIIKFVSEIPTASANDLIHYTLSSDLTISPPNYNPANTFNTTSTEDILLLQHSGYVRSIDVTATAYNEDSLLDIANSSQLKDGDTVWLGFKKDGTWDVLRYTYNPALLIGVFVAEPTKSITFTSQYPHNLSVGQIIGVSQFNDQVNGIHTVIAIPSANRFTVASALANIQDADLPSPGQLYVFASARLSTFDNLPSDQELYRLSTGTKYWIDNSGSWEVYEKINNYSSTPYFELGIPANPHLGSAISQRKGSDIVVVGSPDNYRGTQYGNIWLYDYDSNGDFIPLVKYRFSADYLGQPSGFGSVIVYDDIPFTGSNYGTIFAGAPLAFSNHGIVQISAIDSRSLTVKTTAYINSPNTDSVTKFGSSIFVERNATTKLVLVGAENAVYSYTVSDNAGTITVSSETPLITEKTVNAIAGTDNASFIAVGLAGTVEIYNKSLTKILTLTGSDSKFGTSLSMSPLGEYLFVSSPTEVNDDYSLGKVFVYKNSNGTFVLDQTITNPVIGEGMEFGTAIDVTESTDILAISATGIQHTLPTTFDNSLMTFDGGITKIKGTETGSGSVYLYQRSDSRFVYGQELSDAYIYSTPGTNYGSSLTVDDTMICVGFPALDNSDADSGFLKFERTSSEKYPWDKIVTQDDFVDTTYLKRIALINTEEEQIIEYLDIYDPLKGKIPGIAEQELSFKLVSDPAIYSIGVAGTNNDTEKNWLDEYVGKLWWDLSTAKYIWYEQGDLEYRKNNWGKLFPGATIDIYEWVRSTLLPSEWASQSDTSSGLSQGISGQPKFPDNSVISVKQVYDSVTNSYSNVYYYWVKNKVLVPDRKDRRTSAYAVASAIADPTAYGLRFISIIDKDAIMLSNLGNVPVDSKISINIAKDLEITTTPRHTQWILLKEDSEEDMPPAIFEKKLLDSLLGHDELGNLVPNPELSDRVRYGLGVRPQQTLFKDRMEALRNLVEFSNNVLLTVPITNNYSFRNLNAQEEIPNKHLNEYDHLVEDNSALEIISTAGFERGSINCIVDENGSVASVTIAEPGFGYGTENPIKDITGTVIGYEGPVLTEISNDTVFDNGSTTFDSQLTSFKDSTINSYGSGLRIQTMVDAQGQFIHASVITGGKNFASGFTFKTRPHTVFVQSDDTYNGKWTRYEWDYIELTWSRAHTQSFNTTLYWDYIDWTSTDYKSYQIYSAVVGSPYELSEISLRPNEYVKVNNGGDGNYIVLNKLENGVRGTYGPEYDIVFKQNGTIQINSSIWDVKNSGLGWDYLNTYDETLWDQTPDTEIRYIFTALKNDIFINELKSKWNLLFFTAVRYALTEQKMLDWAFKTSFISVINTAGDLTQPPVYKLQDSAFYESYINEVKPYHTQIREFTNKYSVTEKSNTEVVEQDRTTSVTMKFDRITSMSESGEFGTSDMFIANGVATEFLLNWVPNANKSSITVRVDGRLYLSSEFTIRYFTDLYNGYHKKYANLVFFVEEPIANGSVITISYEKSADLISASDRLLSYYTATSGMVGLDLGQLMYGVDYPGTVVGGQTFYDPRGGIYLDSIVQGGDWQAGVLNSALGVAPNDIIIDGQSGFLTAEAGYAPEENVPGLVVDSLGINVFTRVSSGPAIIYSAKFDTVVSVDTTSYVLSRLPSTIAAISVICNGVELVYTTNELGYDEPYYNLDWDTATLTIPAQSSLGELGYTIVGIGGGSGDAETWGIIDKHIYFAGSETNLIVETVVDFNMIVDSYVTVNGVNLEEVVSSSEYGYMLSQTTSTGKCIINLYNLPVSDNHVVQAWFFDESHDYFNEIREQTFIIDSTSTNYPLTLMYPPGISGPQSAQTIVEITDSIGTRRLLPPETDYYTIETTSTGATFNVSLTNTFTNYLSETTIVVYNNGEIVPFAYSLGVVTVNTTTYVGDTVAIETLLPDVVGVANTLTDYAYDYMVDGTELFIAPGAQVPNSGMIESASIRVITYTNHDGLLMHTEKFNGDLNRRFQMSRPVIDDRYVWVTLFKSLGEGLPLQSYPLINSYDFTILEDNKTVEISDSWVIDPSDFVEIISFISQDVPAELIGYRIFNDMLGGITFTRLSAENSTYLTRNLAVDDDVIYVGDTSVLSPPIEEENIPGIIYINGERIEFTDYTSTSITAFRRGTLGTGPANVYPAGTSVVDQGHWQEIDSIENTYIQNTFTSSSTYTYGISTSTELVYYPGTDDLVRSDGITLSVSSDPLAMLDSHYLTSNINGKDQVDVYYGGRLLRKDGIYLHDPAVSYDSVPVNHLLGNRTNSSLLPTGVSIGASCRLTSNNEIWTFVGTRSEPGATPGWVYSGTKFLPEEFSINVAGQSIMLNNEVLNVADDVQLTIIKKEFAVTDEWNDKISLFETVPLLDSTSTIATFLKERPAELPNAPIKMA